MGVYKMLGIESDVITERSVRIPYKFTNRKSIPKGELKEEYIEIMPMTVRTWFKIKPLLAMIDDQDLDNLIRKEDIVIPDIKVKEIIDKYDRVIIDIICISIWNKPEEVPDWFVEAIMDNSNWNDIMILFNAVFYRIGFNSFINTITIASTVSPLKRGEIIALKKNKKSWTKIKKK